MIATLNRNGTSYGTANKRYFDVCRSVAKIPPSKARKMTAGNREGSVDYEANVQPINPSQRYCANLGHVEDDESDLINMRARYYEPWSGRFVSEDRERVGPNIFTYCENIPSMMVDPDGLAPLPSTFDEWMTRIIDVYDGLVDWKKHPNYAAAMAVAGIMVKLTSWAARAESIGNSATGIGLTTGPLLATGPLYFLPGLLLSLGSLARISAAGMKVAAAVLLLQAMLAIITTEAY